MRITRSVAIGVLLATGCSGQEGTAVFISRCIQCHDANSESHAPLPEALATLPWQDIVKALETGSMKGNRRTNQRRGQTGSRTLSGKSWSICSPRNEGILRGWREAEV
jgi:hypothetical protein